MEINLRKITLEDKAEIDCILKVSDRRFCEYTFGNMFCWGSAFGLEVSVSNGVLVFGYPKEEKFYMPVGDRAAVCKALGALCAEYPKLSLMSLSEKDCALLENTFAGKFTFSEDTRAFDYIYESEKLRSLSGKKLAAKRNHINAFLSEGNWHVEKITDSSARKLLEFNKSWCKNLCGGISRSLSSELCAAERGITYFSALGFSGIMLYKDGRLVAYSYGEPINGDTFCVHVEKADSEVRGAYQMINREFARTFCENYQYINREDDSGDEGLRKAKLSYCPTDIGKKFRAKSKEEQS